MQAPYEIVRLAGPTSAEDNRKAYRRFAEKPHPDALRRPDIGGMLVDLDQGRLLVR